MPHPFPGMNPWLENSNLWKDVHNTLINAIREYLAPQLGPRYFVGVETHTYVTRRPDATLPTTIGTRFPDVAIMDRGGAPVAVAQPPTATEPQLVQIPLDDDIEETFLEIRLVPNGEVVTVVELLSHTNKRAGMNRDHYLHKRDRFLYSNVNFVEIDLLRAYSSMPYIEEEKDDDYRIFIHRREQIGLAFLYTFGVRDEIARFHLPLQPDDEEPIVDLGELLHTVYDRAQYHLIIDYSEAPSPTLSKEDREWAEQLIAEAAKSS